MSIKTLVINPGSTSTKVGVFEDETLLFEVTLRSPPLRSPSMPVSLIRRISARRSFSTS